MNRFTLLTFLLTFSLNSLFSQVTFIIDSLPDYTPPEDTIYIAGDFQGWNPGDPNFALQKNNEDKWFIELESMPNGTTILYKFTRGDWGRVEKGVNGEEIPNREFTYGNGEEVDIIINNWADYGGGNSTAAENVTIIDEEFYIPQLDRYRRIWLYLPPDYEASGSFYPVIYMHDGQNLFDSFTSFAGEWEVDETLNELFEDGYSVPIVVGIDNGGSYRIDEYTPWSNSQYGGGQGSLYIDFMIETLKPYIDQNYRSIPNRESTAIWGSSLGGLISFYGSMKFQDVFSKAGIYSPSYWFSDSVWNFTQEMGLQQEMRLYQTTGSLEGGTMVLDTWAMHDTLTSLGFTANNLSSKIVEGGEHNEQLWREDFAEAYLWLFDDFANSLNEINFSRPIKIVPNPVSDFISIPDEIARNIIQINIYDIRGNIIVSSSMKTSSLDVSSLEVGLFFLEVVTADVHYRGKFIKD